jgi:hypothetical protein
MSDQALMICQKQRPKSVLGLISDALSNKIRNNKQNKMKNYHHLLTILHAILTKVIQTGTL